MENKGISILLLEAIYRDKSCFMQSHSKSNNVLWILSGRDHSTIIFLDNIIVQFGARMFQQTIGIPTGTNCVSLLADLFLHTSGILYKNE
jgi:hypothetical protein